jgi:glucokinase
MERRDCTVGLDVGGTKIAGIVLDLGGDVVEHRTIPTEVERGGTDALDRAVTLAEELVGAARRDGRRPTAIGVGVPELVSPEGAIVSDGVIPWLGLPVAERFSAHLPAILESDVRAAARAEAELGCGRSLHSFAYVNVGTGISSALVIGGRPYVGAHGGAIVLASGAQSCRCPSCGELSSVVLEEIASGPGIVARYRELGGQAERAEDVVEAAGRGDQAATRVVEETTRALGSRIALLVDVLDPEAIVVGGGLGTTPGPFWEALVPAIRSHIWWSAASEIPIHQAALGADAGAVGAALLARDTA